MSQGEKGSPNTSAYEAWADSMAKIYDAKAGQQPSRTEPCTIHRVPHSIRIVDEGAYEPKMLSIGPYHRSNPKLKAMEDHKWHCLRSVLHLYPKVRLSDFLKEMEALEVQVRGFYSENKEIKRIESKEFVEMMLLDGCFLLELLLGAASKEADGKVDDPIYSTKWILPIIRLDMLLLENQLPFLVVNRIFQLINGSNNSFPVWLAVQFFYDVMPIEIDHTAQMDSFHHLLDFFRWHLLPENYRATVDKVRKQPQSPPSIPPATEIQDPGIILRSKEGASSILDVVVGEEEGVLEIPRLPETSVTSPDLEKDTKQLQSPPSIPSATEIQYPGIILRGKLGASSILDVKFEEELGVLKIPRLCIDHSTNSIFRNLIACEQCYPACGNYFTSYAIFMDCLIDTPEDVAILKRSGIIKHWLGNDEQVALLFNKMCMGITINSEGSLLYDLSHGVNMFLKRRSSAWRGVLVRNYFRDPLNTINFQFTVMTIIFTIVQTTLAVLSFKRSP